MCPPAADATLRCCVRILPSLTPIAPLFPIPHSPLVFFDLFACAAKKSTNPHAIQVRLYFTTPGESTGLKCHAVAYCYRMMLCMLRVCESVSVCCACVMLFRRTPTLC